MPLFITHRVFETAGGLEVRPVPALGHSEKKTQYLNQYIGKIIQLSDGSSYAEYMTGEDDTPIVIGDIIDVPVAGVPTPHTSAVKYYHLDGVTVEDISDNETFSKRIGAFYGFNNSHPDYLL